MSKIVETYLVGGAVRDQLLGRDVNDRDWVVVGSCEQDMLDSNYQLVGREFGVFLHPETGEEYALARTERRTGRGHKDFVVHASPDVTLEDDLRRRDLTINAIAQGPDGSLVDPFGGRDDLENKVLRHVSDAFCEDPLRVLRVARFSAQLEGFSIHPLTMGLMIHMVAAGDLDFLTPERVWTEMSKALMAGRPSRFFEVLRQCGALKVLLPEVDALFGVPQPELHHPEVDSGVHTMMVIDRAAELGYGLPVRYACLVHDLGKGLTPSEMLPKHHGHEAAGVPLVEVVSQRYKVPNDCSRLGALVAKEHLRVHVSMEMKPIKLVDLVDILGGYRQGESFVWALQACQCDAQGRLGLKDQPYPQAEFLFEARSIAKSVPLQPILDAGHKGKAIGERLRQARGRALTSMKEDWGC